MQQPKLKALFLNCTLKKSPGVSHTQRLIDFVSKEMEPLNVETETVRIIDFNIPFSIHTHAKDEPKDDWPKIHKKIIKADIIIICSPIWFGTRASVTQLTLERMSGMYDERDKNTGQYPLYNKVGACLVTGNEDGAHDVISNTLFNLTHIGCTIPPNADSYWVGEAGPGPSFGDDDAGYENLFVNRTAKYLAYNTAQLARVLKKSPLDLNLDEIDREVDEHIGNRTKHIRS